MKPWKKPLLYFASLIGCLSIGIAVVIACSDEPDPYDYYTSFFNPGIQGKKDYGAFYFTDYQFTYDDVEPMSEASINSTEWATYLAQPVKAMDVEKVMYDLDSAGKQGVSGFLGQDAPLADSLSSNTFLSALKQERYAAASKYYQFALQAELLNVTGNDYWDPAPVDTAGLTTAANEAMEYAAEETDSFIKLRYYYQAQKLNHYAQNFTKAKEIYEQHIVGVKTNSHVKGWALALKAGEERRLGDTVEAAFLFSKVFADYPERRIQAYRNYHYIEAPFNDVLKKADTPQEKANLYAIRGFANPNIETENLEEVYANAPASPMVGVLLVREINKLEQNYLTPALSNNNDEFYSKGTAFKSDDNAQRSNLHWPFWVGLAVGLLGTGLLIFAIRKGKIKSPTGVIGGLILLGGVAFIVLQFIGKSSDMEKKPQSSGSFYVTMPDSVKNKYDAHIEKLRDFCSTLSTEAKYPEPQIGTLANAYLYFIQNRPDEGLTLLQKADGQKLGEKLSDQKEILKLLLSAQRIKQIKEVDEAALLPSLEWLSAKIKAGGKPKKEVYPLRPEDLNQFAITQRNFYMHVLAPAYLRQGDTSKAALAMLNSRNGKDPIYSDYFFKPMPDFWYNYLHSAQLKQLINWRSNTPKEPYMVFLTKALKQVEENNLYELLGTIQLREHHYDEALVSFRKEKAKLNFARVEEEGISDGDPFKIRINDYAQPNSRGLNKLQFAQKMAQLEAKLKEDPKNAETYFQMANGIYGTSTYGKAWNMISYIWSSYDFGRKSMYYYDADYVKTSTAKQYYLKARDLSTDPEFKAMCTFMAAKCLQKEYEAPSFMDSYENYEEREKAYHKQLTENSYFKEMEQYKSTGFYRKAVNECSYLSDFIAAN